MLPDLLLVGHVVKDVVEGGWRAGGGVAYAAAQATALGLEVAAVTVCGPGLQPEEVLPDVSWQVHRDGVSTVFENRYADGERRQRLLSIARPLTLEDIPAGWLNAPTALIMPVFHDVAPLLPGQLRRRGALVGIGAQGWLRRLEGDRVRPLPVEPSPPWLNADVVFLSEEDAEDPEHAQQWTRTIPMVVLTRGGKGCTLWESRTRHDVPAFVAPEVDPTGAGDVFAATFLVRLRESGDALDAARFASVAAALSLRAPAFEGIGSRQDIEAQLDSTKVASRP